MRFLYTGSMLILIFLFTTACEDKRLQTYTANVPIYLSYEDLRKTIEAEPPQDIRQPGKIYFMGDYIYINEYMEGVHVVNISNPELPVAESFIPVPGNIEMAIKDNILYLDSYVDLVLVDIENPGSPVVQSRIEDLLEYTTPEFDVDYPVARVDDKKGVVTGWEVKKHTEEVYMNHYPWPMYYRYDEAAMLSSSSIKTPVTSGGSAYGVGGSMARFLTYDDYLYLLETDYRLKVLDISNIEEPVELEDKHIGWGLETMFIYGEHMYLGATDGLYIVSLHDPEQPAFMKKYQHITSCDPVVVEGNRAYVTLRSGNFCGGNQDLLEVVDISDKYDPDLIASYPMTEPYGLGIADQKLFICEGEHGLKVYDASDAMEISDHLLAEFTDIQATDVIPIDTLLFTIGDSGFHIYDFSDVTDIRKLGEILVD